MERSAEFDQTGIYRYRLTRLWDPHLPCVAFVMLNPSRADAERDDPTIRRCIGFARAWGYGSLTVVNLFAYRAVTPLELFRASDPIGLENSTYLQQAAAQCNTIVAAWGNYGARLRQAEVILPLLPNVQCLGVTAAGQPRHPLYTLSVTLPIPYSLPARPASPVQACG